MVLIFVFLFNFLARSTTAFFQNDTSFVHHRMELISYNHDYARNLKLAMVPLNRTKRALNCSFDLLKDLTQKIVISIEASKFVSNEYRYFPFRFAFDFCKVENEDYFGIRDVQKFSNIVTCPLMKGHYYVNKYRLDESKFSPHLIPGDYKMVANLTYGSDKLCVVHWYGSIKAVEKLRWE